MTSQRHTNDDQAVSKTHNVWCRGSDSMFSKMCAWLLKYIIDYRRLHQSSKSTSVFQMR